MTTSLKTPVVAGLVLGLLVVAWTFVMGFTGWYLDPALLNLFWIVILFQIVVLVVTLRRTRPGRRYGAQVGVGLITSAVAAVLVFLGSLLFTGVVFPDYFADLREAQERMLLAEGMSPEDVQQTLDDVAPSQTPGSQAWAGFMGTLGTGMVVSLVAAIFLRDRDG